MPDWQPELGMWGVLASVAKYSTSQEIFGRELEDFLRPLSSVTYRNRINQSLTLKLHSPHLIYTLINDDY